MKTRFSKAAAMLIMFFAVVMTIPGYTQEDITTVSDDAFVDKMRPSVPFLHDEHNEAAEIEECNTCHHVYEEGKKVDDESSEDRVCSECHLTDTDKSTMPLVRAYHLRCKGCHQQKKAGPVQCGECHRKTD